MQTQAAARRHAAALAGVLACLALALLLFHDLAGGTLLAANPYDSYALQAENWLAGRNYIAGGAQYPWLELAIYQGRYYQSFPPVPAVALLPWVALCGGAAAVPSNLAIALWALGAAAGVYACFWRRGASPATAAYFAVFCALGSNLFWLASSGGVWFLAQVLGFALAVWGAFFALAGTPAGDALASACLAAAVGCRPFYAVLGLAWGVGQLRRAVRQRRAAALLPALLPAAIIAAAMMAYNLARFGNPLEFGHTYLPEFQREADGQFSLAYLASNLRNLLRPVGLSATLALEFPAFNGFLPFVANPLFTLWLGCGLAALRRRTPPPGPLALPSRGAPLAAICLALTLLTCMHRTLGGWQFGARYFVDLLPYALLWFLGQPHWQPRAAALSLCGMAVLFNLYGAVHMLLS